MWIAAMIDEQTGDTHIERQRLFFYESEEARAYRSRGGWLRARLSAAAGSSSQIRDARLRRLLAPLRQRSHGNAGGHRTAAGARVHDGRGTGDFFSYGIHTTEMLQGCAGTGVRSVRVVSRFKAPVMAVTYHDGFEALLHLQLPFHEWSLSAYTDQGLRTATVSIEGSYEPFLQNFISLLKGGDVDYSLEGPVEAVRVHIAAKIALERGAEVSLDTLPDDAGFSGRVFAEEYAAMKRRQ